MVTLTIKLPLEVKRHLEREARTTGRSVSALIREALGERLRKSSRAGSLYERTRDLCGIEASGRRDLATNADHLRGFGE